MPALRPGYQRRPTHVKPSRARAKPKPPTATQLRSSRAQGRYYGSQGRAITRQAATQRVLGPGSVTHSRARLRQIQRDRKRRAKEKRVRDALKAERAYLLGGRAIPRLAARQRTTSRALATERYYSTFTPKGKVLGAELGLKGADANRYMSVGEAAKRLSAGPGRGSPQLYQAQRRELAHWIGSEGVQAAKAHQAQRKAARLAPIVSVLEQVQRPAYASAGAARAALKGENVLRGAARGALLKDRYLYSDVLEAAGVHNKLIRSIAGFGLDVALDPSTYVTFGTAKVATKATATAVERAAREAAEQAAKDLKPLVQAGELSARRARQQVKAAGRDAGKKVLERELSKGAHKGRGVQVRVAGARVPGVTRATAAVGRAQRRGIEAVTPASVRRLVSRAGLRSRDVAAAVNPTVRPPTMTGEQFARTRQVARRERGEAGAIERRAAQRAVVMQALTRPSEWRLIRDAIERGDIESLKGTAAPLKVPVKLRANKRARALARDPDRLYRFARGLTEDWTRMRQELVDLGVPVGYVGPKPPVQIPEVTADVAAARRELTQVSRARQRAEIEQVEAASARQSEGERRARAALTRAEDEHARALEAYEQIRSVPHSDEVRAEARRAVTRAASDVAEGKAAVSEARAERLVRRDDLITPRQRAHAREQAQHARTRYQHARDDFARAERAALEATGAERAALKADARAARRQMASAQTDLRRWGDVARLPGTHTALGEAGRLHAVERHVTQRLRQTKAQAARERKAQREAQRSAEIREREAKGYVPRISKEAVRSRGRVASVEDLLEGQPRYASAHTGPTKQRKIVEPLATLERERPEYVAKLEESLPVIAQSYGGAMGRRIARARAARTLFEEGKPPTAGVSEGERVYRYEHGDLHELDAAKDADEIEAAIQGRASGDYVTLPKGQVDRLRERPQPQSAEVQRALAGWNRAMGAWRAVALGQPAYVVRNAFSDLFAAYTEQGAARLARNYVRGHRTLKAQRRSERGYRWFEDQMEQAGKGKGIYVDGRFMPYRVLAAEAEAAGGIRAGRMAEISEQRRVGKGERLPAPKGQGAYRRLVERVEDQARIATYAGARERGMSPDEAAALVAKAHFDYGELSKIERGSRALFPFQTFTLRNLPRQAQVLATRPGKLAAYAHARDEATRAIGDELPANYQEGLDEYEARQVGIPIRFGGQTYTVSAGLPFTDLNDLVPAKPGDLKQWAKLPPTLVTTRAAQLAGPWKLPFELVFNYSTQYRQQISDPNRPHRPVPAPVAALADRSPALRRQLGITPYQDAATGEKSWGWDSRLDQVFRGALPGAPGTALRSTYRKRGEPLVTGEEIVSALGVRAKRFDPRRAEINRLYRAKEPLERRRAILNQGGVNAEHPTRAYRRLLDRITAIDSRIEAIRKGSRGRAAVGQPRGSLRRRGGGIGLPAGSIGEP